MKLTEFLVPENVLFDVDISSKKRVLELIGQKVADYLNLQQCETENVDDSTLCPLACFSNLFKREKLGSTGINQGVALPHAKLPDNSKFNLEKPIAIFLKLAEPIDYDASDNKNVDLIYAFLFSEKSCAGYKHCLPQIAETLSNKALLKQLRAAESVEDIWQILDRSEVQNSESEI